MIANKELRWLGWTWSTKTETSIAAFVMFFVVVDPIGVVPLFVSLTEIGEIGVNVLTRVFGVITAALAVQFIFDGALAVWPGA